MDDPRIRQKTASMQEVARALRDLKALDDPIINALFLFVQIFIILPVILGTIIIILGWHKEKLNTPRLVRTWMPFGHLIAFGKVTSVLESYRFSFELVCAHLGSYWISLGIEGKVWGHIHYGIVEHGNDHVCGCKGTCCWIIQWDPSDYLDY
jgi:hypothetical protein